MHVNPAKHNSSVILSTTHLCACWGGKSTVLAVEGLASEERLIFRNSLLGKHSFVCIYWSTYLLFSFHHLPNILSKSKQRMDKMARNPPQDNQAEVQGGSLWKFVILFILISLAGLRYAFCQEKEEICTYFWIFKCCSLKGYYVLYCFYRIDRKMGKKLYMLYYHVYTLLSEQESKDTASEKVGIKTA